MKTNISYIIIIILLGIASLLLWRIPKSINVVSSFEVDIPQGFPKIPVPDNNKLSAERIELGRQLFYDVRLSKDSSISCSSCHLASAAFSDHQTLSVGINQLVGHRNVPTLTNVAYHPYFFKEGGSPTLEAQVLGPICTEEEMGFNAVDVVSRLAQDPHYVKLAKEAYQREFDLFVITRALASFERTLLSGNSPFDHYRNKRDSTALTLSQGRGMTLFFSDRLACGNCHGGFDFTNYQFENIGLYEEYKDHGRFRITQDSADIGKFKVPTLRNIVLTAPYMHDGSISTLAEVIDHYNKGGAAHPNRHQDIKPLSLTQEEKDDLIQFLYSLTDSSFINDQRFQLASTY